LSDPRIASLDKENNMSSESREADRRYRFFNNLLAALVIGGGAAVVANTGIFKAFGKFIVMGIVAVFVAISGFFKRVFGRKRQG
jgi:hypothetical protein